ETREHVLPHERLSLDGIDRAVGALEEPQVAVARCVDQAFDGAAVALVIHDNARRHFVPVPRLIRMVLVIALDLAGGHVDRERRRGVEVIALALIAHPRTAVARAPEREIRVRIVVGRDPYGGAAGLPLSPPLRPRLAAGLARGGDGVGSPQLLAGVDVERRDKSANAELAARTA